MSRTTTAAVQADKASRPKTALAGTPEPADENSYYVVDPGEAGLEYFSAEPSRLRELDGLGGALSRARFLSFISGVPQKLTRHYPEPGRPDNTFVRYAGGQAISRVT